MRTGARGHRVAESAHDFADAEPSARAVVVGAGPGRGSAASLLRLQQSVGNRAVNSVLALAQAKLEVGAVDDPAECEADAVAASVVHALDTGVAPSDPSDRRV